MPNNGDIRTVHRHWREEKEVYKDGCWLPIRAIKKKPHKDKPNGASTQRAKSDL